LLVRQALNHAVDVDAIVAALRGGHGSRLANVFPDGGMGFDPALEPYGYDPERARALLREANLEVGFETSIAVASTERIDVVEAIAGQLGEVGIHASVKPIEVATFNQSWADPAADPLRFVTWRPVFDPYTLLGLIFSKGGFLSRHDNPEAQALIDAAAVETDPSARTVQYQQLGTVMKEQPGAIYLWSLTALYGASSRLTAWTPRPDDYLIPTARV
jgi:ABC-type transport system substrate-binding protein